MYSIIAVTNKHTAKLHHVGSLYILTYDARKLKHKIQSIILDLTLKPPLPNLCTVIVYFYECLVKS